jgi:hypothetical protein
MTDEQKIQQVVSKYVRAADARDGGLMGSLFLEKGVAEIHFGPHKPTKQLAVLEGAEVIKNATSQMMKPHAKGNWSHHTAMNPIIEISGDLATIDTQFIVYATSANPSADQATTSPAGFYGSIIPVESGYYSHQLQKVNGEWKIAKVIIVMDIDFKQS